MDNYRTAQKNTPRALMTLYRDQLNAVMLRRATILHLRRQAEGAYRKHGSDSPEFIRLLPELEGKDVEDRRLAAEAERLEKRLIEEADRLEEMLRMAADET